MKKILINLLIVFKLFSLSSCHTTSTLTSMEEYQTCYKKTGYHYSVNKAYKVTFLTTKQSDTIVFNKKEPGRILNTGVFGKPEAHLKYNTIDSTDFYYTLNTIWKNGIPYQYIGQDSLGYVCLLSETINIPLAEIKLMHVDKLNKKPRLALIAIPVGVGIAVIVKACNDINNLSW